MENNQNPNLNEEIVLEVNNLKMYFDISTGFFKTTPLKAVDGVTFKIKKGETLGVVGESGCGKTTLGRTIMNLYKASSGEVIFEGQLISSYSDLNRIKVEKKFELKSLKYEKNKRIKAYEKENKGENVDLENFKASFEAYKQSQEEEYIRDREALIAKYDELYKTKAEEIQAEIEASNAKAQEEISKLERVERSSDEEAVNLCDNKTAELKAKASGQIQSEKDKKKLKIDNANEKKAKSLEEYKELKLKFAEEEKALHDELKSQADQELKAKLQKDYNFMVKDHKNDIIVKKEKIKGDYKIELSIAEGDYKNAVDDINDKLKSDIKELRSQSKYYSYIDQVNEISNKNKEEVKKIKSSSYFRLKNFRKKCTMVFQDPYSSLNPRMTVQDIIAEPLDVNKLYNTKAERRSKVLALMKMVGLSPEHSTRYAHEFSGGQRQRIGIARALAVNPSFVVCDEPVSALDVSIQAQVINTFKDLQNELGLTYLFIAHDLLVVRHISDRIAVMYLGRVVEIAETNELFDSPLHPYTQSLLSAVPMPDPETARNNKRIILEGDVPSPLNVPTGCPFRTRCPKATERCKMAAPKLTEVKPGHFASCFLLEKSE